MPTLLVVPLVLLLQEQMHCLMVSFEEPWRNILPEKQMHKQYITPYIIYAYYIVHSIDTNIPEQWIHFPQRLHFQFPPAFYQHPMLLPIQNTSNITYKNLLHTKKTQKHTHWQSTTLTESTAVSNILHWANTASLSSIAWLSHFFACKKNLAINKTPNHSNAQLQKNLHTKKITNANKKYSQKNTSSFTRPGPSSTSFLVALLLFGSISKYLRIVQNTTNTSGKWVDVLVLVPVLGAITPVPKRWLNADTTSNHAYIPLHRAALSTTAWQTP